MPYFITLIIITFVSGTMLISNLIPKYNKSSTTRKPAPTITRLIMPTPTLEPSPTPFDTRPPSADFHTQYVTPTKTNIDLFPSFDNDWFESLRQKDQQRLKDAVRRQEERANQFAKEYGLTPFPTYAF